jgi:hypothetical protein
LDLGTLLLDNAAICFDKESYNEMDKDNKADLIQQYEVPWDHKIEFELKKHGIKKIGTKLVKHKKWSTIIHVKDSGWRASYPPTE